VYEFNIGPLFFENLIEFDSCEKVSGLNFEELKKEIILAFEKFGRFGQGMTSESDEIVAKF